MKLVMAGSGSYPRIGDSSEQQILRRTIARWERGEASEAELREVERKVTKEVIEEQVRAGLELVTDGQVRWYDPLSHIAGKLEGVKINGLLRFFDTNFYFRQPVVQGDLRRRAAIIADEYSFARSVSPRPVKPVLTGPYTLARLSIVEHDRYKRPELLVADYARTLAEEVRELARRGAEIIQIDEPAALVRPSEFGLVAEAVKPLAAAKDGASIALYTYFADAAPLYRKLLELPVDIIGLDFTYSAKLVELVAAEGSPKPLALGLIDGRNTRLEEPQAILKALEKLLPAIKADTAYLNPSCGLEYLPRDRAFEKLKNMVRIGNEFLKGGGR